MPVLKPLSGDGEAPQQRKQPSRKGKKAWRKNVDVTDVQDGLDELNKQIITGGVVAEKDSADLFALDTVGKALPKPKTKKTLKSDEIIAARSAVPAVSGRKKRSSSPSKTSDGLLPVKRQRTTDWVSHKELARLRKVADGQHESSITVQDATYDLWGAAAPAPAAEPATAGKDNFVPPVVKAKPPKTLKHKPISLTASGKPLPAVVKPSGGYSYNPTFDDYADRLEAESAKAVAAEEARLAAEEAERLKREAIARSAAEADAADRRAQLSEWDEDSAWEGFESGVENDDDKPSQKRPQRKTPQQRNRIKRRKEAEREAKHQLAMKKKAAQAERIKQIATELAERDAAKSALELAREVGEGSDADDDDEDIDDDAPLRRRQLGKYKLPEKDLELVLPDELQDSLRLLKPEGNLLKDRYRSMLLRGKVEVRRHLPFKKQARSKVTEKWSYKDFKI
ncbi:Ribosome biogenesis protein NOP53 [Colletotrichum siamense]|uniref:Ribosome biogenesis protein NOP53 n=2 Tax=Colletotrichum gloeosporioides species complex TaxID=2707338 RepID=A0A9P5K7I8_COLSI|nr:Ribosome biogenesis protein NOP53 [Colletotrichum siamense]KAF4856887.1 Ribosome biogenesis protein NOP53 [Colletotrichum siamense]KAF4862202.1 Ribosome biogenesis protein NOP53 [Colletotrichum siamense]KAI8242431.1 Ribosome biogenesis protein NOP53 [Colletotrichum sp. SAR 10_96]KAI8291164.1 Ribosome biogenesis protein NOP53 [Colletotrichum sp. SAR 10_98]